MKKKLLSFLLLAIVTLGSVFSFVACDMGSESASESNQVEAIDYAAQVKLDLTSDTNKQEVTVKYYIDGDTTHFNVPTEISDNGVLKARYLAVNTPESTGKIEEWGKKASNYTKSTLQSATSIIIESNDSKWNLDSTGERHLVWVWYKNAETADYRCLNIELLQYGLAVGSSAGSTRYGEVCVQAINHATQLKIHIYSNEKDPDYFYGEAYEIDLKELRLNLEYYKDKRVAFEGIVTMSNASSNGIYVENYNEEAQAYYGIYVYYGFDLNSMGLKILSVGNRVRIVGNVQYYETGDSWQISDIDYNPYKPTDPDKIQLISEGNTITKGTTSIETFNSTITVSTLKTDEEGNLVVDENNEPVETFKQVPYAEIAMHTTIMMKDLKVVSSYTTNNGGDNDGAITLTCKVDGKTITVRTMKLYQKVNDVLTLVTADAFTGKTITVKGIVDEYDGSYQIKVFAFDDITFQN